MVWTSKLVLGGMISAALAATSVAAQTASRWRDAFQSSPATYDPFSPELLQVVAERTKQTPEALAESMKPRPVNGTIRYRVTVSAPGSMLRVRVSNEDGESTLRLTGASVALAGEGFSARARSVKRLTFGGAAGVVIPPGAPMLSDPVGLPVPAGAELLVSFTLGAPMMNDTRGGRLFVVAPGDQSGAETLQDAKELLGRPAVTGISVAGGPTTRVIVALGDSITDGNREKLGVLQGWPERLARRLSKAGMTDTAIVNAGIGGNRLLASGWGDAGLARLDRDVLRLEGISHLLLLEGINDIGFAEPAVFGKNNVEITANDLIAGYRQVIARAHARGVKVILATILPAGGSPSHSSPSKDAIRVTVNNWIRTSGEPDAVVDFAKIVSDPASPDRLRPEYDSGDHLHPSDAGYAAIGDAIDLALFRKK